MFPPHTDHRTQPPRGQPQRVKPSNAGKPDPQYLYVRAWGQFVGSKAYYIADQVALAKHDRAPQRAIFRGAEDGRWRIVDDIGGATERNVVESIAQAIRDQREAEPSRDEGDPR